MSVDEKELIQIERTLRRAATTYRKDEDRRKLSYEAVLGEMRAASDAGLSYDRIAQATKMSKTHIARLLRN